MSKKTSKQAPKSSKSTSNGRASLADLFDDTDVSEASNNLPAGEHEVQLTEIALKEDPKKGLAVTVKYTALDGDYEGKSVRQLYKLTDAEGNKANGMAYLKRDLALLGYSELSGKKLKKTLAALTEEQPMVVITVKENGQYVNAYLSGPVGEGDSKFDDDDEDDAPEFEVGDTVTFDLDDEETEGEIVKIKGDTATVKVGKKEHKVDLGDLSKADSDSDDEDEDSNDDEDEDEEEAPKKGKGATPKGSSGKSKSKIEDGDDDEDEDEDEDSDDEEQKEIEEGSKVTYEGDEYEVVKINQKKGTATIVDEDGEEKKNIPLDELDLSEGGSEDDEDSSSDDDDDEIAEGDEVSFEDEDGDDQTGEVIKIDKKKGQAKVKVGKKTHVVDLDDLTKE